MTTALQQAFAAAAMLPEREQELLAARLLAELEAENAFDGAIAASAESLRRLAAEALQEYQTGQTEPLVPERL